MDNTQAYTYKEVIEWLFSQLPMFQRVGSIAYKKDLSNTLALCKILNNPHKKLKTIHIAGTNGKGSTAHMLAAIFQEHGYKTGLYTSPHLLDFRERIKINGQMVSEAFVINFVKNLKPIIGTLQPSFFEYTVAMAFDFFSVENVDIAIIETGLGGRLDSTNVITPLLSIITNIDWDHMDLLGNTLPLIAAEKAGIIKPDVPVVIGETHPETKGVFDSASNEKRAPIKYADQLYSAIVERVNTDKQFLKVSRLRKMLPDYELDLTGAYQVYNLQTVLCALDTLQNYGYQFDENLVRSALKNVKIKTGLRGRFEWLSKNPPILADTGHNLAGITKVWEQIKKLHYEAFHVVLGCVNDKDLSNILHLYPKDAKYYFCAAKIPRAMPVKEIAKLAESFGLKGKEYESVLDATTAAAKACKENELVVISGSTFTVAEALLWQQ